ncbi:hypothetical protein MRX96_029794 [Rhipicephalus microplus]
MRTSSTQCVKPSGTPVLSGSRFLRMVHSRTTFASTASIQARPALELPPCRRLASTTSIITSKPVRGAPLSRLAHSSRVWLRAGHAVPLLLRRWSRPKALSPFGLARTELFRIRTPVTGVIQGKGLLGLRLADKIIFLTGRGATEKIVLRF